MKFQARFHQAFAWIALLLLVSCKKPSSSRTTAAATKELALAWNLRTLPDAYDSCGNRNPKWDNFVRRALVEFARTRAHSLATNEPFWEIISTNCSSAVQAGCDDPLLGYLSARFVLTEQNHTVGELAEAYVRSADGLEQSSYPEIRKFYAALRAAQTLKDRYGTDTNAEPQIFKFRHAAVHHLLSAVQDKQMPAQEVDDACSELLTTLEINKHQLTQFYQELEPVLFKNWPNESFSWLLRGRAYIQMAWEARGTGYANTVTQAGWQEFARRLGIAEQALNKAWELNPLDSRIAVKMLTVALGQGKSRSDMELWFKRAMNLDPDCYDACYAKLYYLEPKWYGSVEEMLKFGRECVQSQVWGGKVPLILADAHWSIFQQYNKIGEDYWKLPGVWDDLHASFERFFQLNPKAISWRHNYAWYAYHCRQWDELSKQLTLLGSTNYAYFGGKAEFDKMLRELTEHGN